MTLTFLRDWLPSAAVVVASVFVLLKFILSELSRREKEAVAIDGDLDVSAISLDERRYFITVQARWRNPSPRVVRVDTKASRIDVYIVPANLPLGAVIPKRDLGNPVVRLHLYENMDSFFLEPNTESLLPSHYVLEGGYLYLVRWKLYKYVGRRAPFAYTKERMCDLRVHSPKARDVIKEAEFESAPNPGPQADSYAAA
jgi:hypothetical protein